MALCIIDLRQNGEALRTARAVRAQHPQAVVIGIADPNRPTASADAILAGVFDVLPRPASARDLEALIANAREQAALASSAPLDRTIGTASYGIAGSSPAMRLVMDLVQRAAAGRCGILICGERGSGREMIARAIHSHDPNPHASFVKVDCSGPTPEDIELQLFGSVTRQAGARQGSAGQSGAGHVERRSLRTDRQHLPTARCGRRHPVPGKRDGPAGARTGAPRSGPARS